MAPKSWFMRGLIAAALAASLSTPAWAIKTGIDDMVRSAEDIARALRQLDEGVDDAAGAARRVDDAPAGAGQVAPAAPPPARAVDAPGGHYQTRFPKKGEEAGEYLKFDALTSPAARDNLYDNVDDAAAAAPRGGIARGLDDDPDAIVPRRNANDYDDVEAARPKFDPAPEVDANLLPDIPKTLLRAAPGAAAAKPAAKLPAAPIRTSKGAESAPAPLGGAARAADDAGDVRRVARVALADPATTATTVKKNSRGWITRKKLLVSGSVLAVALLVGGTTYGLYEGVRPVCDAFNAAYDATRDSAEKRADALLTVTNGTKAEVRIVEVLGRCTKPLATLTKLDEKQVIKVKVGDRIKILLQGKDFTGFVMDQDETIIVQ